MLLISRTLLCSVLIEFRALVCSESWWTSVFRLRVVAADCTGDRRYAICRCSGVPWWSVAHVGEDVVSPQPWDNFGLDLRRSLHS